jgi:hypothetical protein
MNATLGVEICLEFVLIVSFVSLNRISMMQIENINYSNQLFISDKSWMRRIKN